MKITNDEFRALEWARNLAAQKAGKVSDEEPSARLLLLDNLLERIRLECLTEKQRKVL